MCTVTLQPFDYDVNEKYAHKFMVQSIIIPDNATQQEVDSLVCICPVTILMCVLLLLFCKTKDHAVITSI